MDTANEHLGDRSFHTPTNAPRASDGGGADDAGEQQHGGGGGVVLLAEAAALEPARLPLVARQQPPQHQLLRVRRLRMPPPGAASGRGCDLPHDDPADLISCSRPVNHLPISYLLYAGQSRELY